MVRVKNTPPSPMEIQVMQEFYDRGFSVRQTGKEFGWSKQCLLRYITVRHPVVSEEERKRRKVENVVNWRQRTKKKLVEYKGSKCEMCGYDRCIENLTFHHIDPSQKDFQISGTSKAFETLKKEVDKCQMLCRNCHGEVHANNSTLAQLVVRQTVNL